MAKTRPGSSKRGRSKKSHHKSKPQSDAPASSSARPSKSPRILVDEAEAAMTQGDVQRALEAARKAQRALEDASSGNANNNIVIDGVGLAAVHALVGEIHLESGDVEDARAALDRSVALDPEGILPGALGGGVDKFLYMAQLSEAGGRDSLMWFERGAGALRILAARQQEKEKTYHSGKAAQNSAGPARAHGDDNGGDDAAAIAEEEFAGWYQEGEKINEKLAQILCAMAEVWMTDLSFEAECEAECERLTTEAALVNNQSPEVWQTLANVRVSQSRPADAKAALQRSLDLWENLPPTHADVPAFSVRVSLVRLLLTIGWLDKAIDVTMLMLREDEQSVEVWYLAGYAHYLTGQALKEGGEQVRWQSSWRDARRCLGRCLRRFRQQEYEDERLGNHAAELLEEVEAAVGPAPQKEKDEEDYDDEDEDDEWEDEEDGGEDGGNEEDENEDEEME